MVFQSFFSLDFFSLGTCLGTAQRPRGRPSYRVKMVSLEIKLVKKRRQKHVGTGFISIKKMKRVFFGVFFSRPPQKKGPFAPPPPTSTRKGVSQ